MADVYDFAAARLPAATVAAIGGLWQRFAAAVPRLDARFRGQRDDVDVESEMAAVLGPWDGTLYWEFGPNDHGGHHLAVTAELNHELRALARAIAARAPDMAPWSFSDSRPPEQNPEVLPQVVAGRSGAAEVVVDSVELEAGPHRRINVTGVSANRDESLVVTQAGLAFSGIMGEAIERDWLGYCTARRPGAIRQLLGGGKAAADGAPFASLRSDAEELIAAAMAECPDRPFSARELDEGEFSLFEIGAGEGDDLPGQGDRFTNVSRYPELVQAWMGDPEFSSARFSRFGETFCYLKIDGSGDDPIGVLEDRGELEETIDGAIRPAGLGGIVGGGTGSRYSYVDLALTDVEGGIDALAARLREAGVTRRAWVQFLDAGLERLWVPVWPDSPPPPMPREN